MKDYPPWTAYRSDDYGYTRMTIHNDTHLYVDQVSVDLVREPALLKVHVVHTTLTFSLLEINY